MSRGVFGYALVVGLVWAAAGVVVGLLTQEWRWAVLVVSGLALVAVALVRRPSGARRRSPA
jgi:membrane protein implicated in regulation of membrane protease activity